MTVRAIRVISDATPNELNSSADRERRLIEKHGEKVRLPEQAQPVRRMVTEGGTEYYQAIYRVSTQAASAVLDDIAAEMVDRIWWRIDTHLCRHDSDPPRPCDDWVVERSFGIAPEGA